MPRTKKSLKNRNENCKKKYCGDKDELPDGYYRFGTRSECLRKGFGSGYYKAGKDVDEALYKGQDPRKLFSKQQKDVEDKKIKKLLKKYLKQAIEISESLDINEIIDNLEKLSKK